MSSKAKVAVDGAPRESLINEIRAAGSSELIAAIACVYAVSSRPVAGDDIKVTFRVPVKREKKTRRYRSRRTAKPEHDS